MLQPAAWIALIEFVGALLIVGHCLAGLVELARTGDLSAVRLLVIQGSLWGLDLKMAASLLTTIEIHSWDQIAKFAAILALRTLVKRVMAWEQARLQGPRPTPPARSAGGSLQGKLPRPPGIATGFHTGRSGSSGA